MNCDHSEGNDPRKAGQCCKCGLPMPPGSVPVPAEQRNIRAEREILERIVGPKSASVWAFAQTRAHPGPVRDFATRDLVRDAVEEASDQINYGTWGIQQMEALDTQDPRKGDVFAAFATALLHATEAYNALAAVHPAYLELLAERA